MAVPLSLKREISPPLVRKPSLPAQSDNATETPPTAEQYASTLKPTLAAIEAGEAQIRDHLAYFSEHLAHVKRSNDSIAPTLGIQGFQDLYKRNSTPGGRHFVVHQHDHPVSGVHYDLRLQFSETSSISFAIPYGLPGNPNSIRPNRMAIETRVHNLWNNLIESASYATGSLLIWDTGEFEVLPRHLHTKKARETDDEASASSEDDEISKEAHNRGSNTKLFTAFQNRHIRLRLHGIRLPSNYTISLRLTSANTRDHQPRKPSYKRRRKASTFKPPPAASPMSSDSEAESSRPIAEQSSTTTTDDEQKASDAAAASDGEGEDETIRLTNAYPGATNTIGSIHQRHWFLTLDRLSSGFVKASSGPDKGRWVRNADADEGAARGFGTFYVRGREHERSLITGRLAQDVMDDEGVVMFMGRKMWRPITE